MDKNFYSLFTLVKQTYCDNCADKEYCNQHCKTNAVLDSIRRLDTITAEGTAINEQGCQQCVDKKGKVKEIFYDTGRGGLSIAQYCPNCGKKLN